MYFILFIRKKYRRPHL